MFQENLKTLRKQRGFTQETLAERLNVVRQTVSKWEKGLSVPDAELLVKLSEILEVPVSTLLGRRIEGETEPNAVAEQLARINEQLVIKNRRAKRIWAVAAIAIGGWLLLQLLVFASVLLFRVEVSNGITETSYQAEWEERAE